MRKSRNNVSYCHFHFPRPSWPADRPDLPGQPDSGHLKAMPRGHLSEGSRASLTGKNIHFWPKAEQKRAKTDPSQPVQTCPSGHILQREHSPSGNHQKLSARSILAVQAKGAQHLFCCFWHRASSTRGPGPDPKRNKELLAKTCQEKCQNCEFMPQPPCTKGQTGVCTPWLALSGTLCSVLTLLADPTGENIHF